MTRKVERGLMESAGRTAESARDAMMQSFQAVDELQRQARSSVESYLRYLPDGAGRSGLLPRFKVLDGEVDEAIASYLATLDARPLRERMRLEDVTQATYAFQQCQALLRSLAGGVEQFLTTYDTEFRRVGQVLRRIEQTKATGVAAETRATAAWTELRGQGYDSADADRALARVRVASRHLAAWSVDDGPSTLDELGLLVTRLADETVAVAAAYPARVARVRRRRDSLRTRFGTLDLAGERIDSRLSDLRREFSRPNSADLDDVGIRAAQARAATMEAFSQYAAALEASDWDVALDFLERLESLTEVWSAVVGLPETRLGELRGFAKAPQDQVAKVRFALRDAQMLLSRSTRADAGPHVAELDRLARRLDTVRPSDSAHPDLFAQIRLLEDIRRRVAETVAAYRANAPTDTA